MNARNVWIAAALSAAVSLGVETAHGQQYRFPIELPSSGTQPYVTAYRDHNATAGALQDWDCKAKTYDGHKGSDFGIGSWPVMDSGSRWIVAAADGKVVFANDGCFDRCSTGDCNCGSGFGNYVKLEHADGKLTYYAHMLQGSVAVSVGQQVKCGDHLGKVGSSGYSTGPHLHFEPRYASNTSDEPFAGACGGPTSFWVNQGAYLGLPSDQCENPPPPPLDDAKLVTETLPAGSVVTPGASVDKSWTLENTGNTTWTQPEGFTLAHIGGDALGSSATANLGTGESIAPSSQKSWSVSLSAPTTPGTYAGDFRMDHSGTKFGPTLHFEIVVEAPADGGAGNGGQGTGGWGAGTGASVSVTGGSGGMGAGSGQQATQVMGDVKGGCACRSSPRRTPGGPWIAWAATLVALARRRRRARGS